MAHCDHVPRRPVVPNDSFGFPAQSGPSCAPMLMSERRRTAHSWSTTPGTRVDSRVGRTLPPVDIAEAIAHSPMDDGLSRNPNESLGTTRPSGTGRNRHRHVRLTKLLLRPLLVWALLLLERSGAATAVVVGADDQTCQSVSAPERAALILEVARAMVLQLLPDLEPVSEDRARRLVRHRGPDRGEQGEGTGEGTKVRNAWFISCLWCRIESFTTPF